MSTWSELPGHLLALIADKLICTTDYFRFGAVCVSWRFALASWGSTFTEYQDYQRRHLPLLMIPTNKDNKQTRSLYCLIERKVLDVQLPVPHDKICRGSTHGWLVTVDENLAVYLLNPFSTINNEIQLPPLTAFSKLDEHDDPIFYGVGHLRKAVLSANPTSTPNYTAMIIYGGCDRLAFFKAGDKAWTSFDFDLLSFDDMIFYKGQFYAVDHLGRVLVFDVAPYPTVTKIIQPPTNETMWRKRYLVESSGELLQVRRVVSWSDEEDAESDEDDDRESDEDDDRESDDEDDDTESDAEDDDTESDDDEDTESRSDGDDMRIWSTIEFQVFKLDPIGFKWIEVKNLLDRVIFLGDNTSMSLSALDFPGCKPNCIYFTDDYYSHNPKYWHHDMGVFNLEDRSFEPHYPIDSQRNMPAPIWVEPMLLSRGPPSDLPNIHTVIVQ